MQVNGRIELKKHQEDVRHRTGSVTRAQLRKESPIKVVPKGLRSYDKDDAHFFRNCCQEIESMDFHRAFTTGRLASRRPMRRTHLFESG